MHRESRRRSPRRWPGAPRSSPTSRSAASSPARRGGCPARDALPIVRALLARSEDAGDIHMPLLLWWAIEAKAGTDPEAVLAMFEDRSVWSLPIVQARSLERADAAFRRGGHADGPGPLRAAAGAGPGPGRRQAADGRFRGGLRGPIAGRAADRAGRGPGEVQRAVADVRPAPGEARGASPRPCACWPTSMADRSKQLQLLQVLGEVRRPSALPVVLRLACHSPDNALRAAALSALAGYDDPAIAAEVLAAYPNMSDDVQAAAQSLLASRRAWAGRFLEAHRGPVHRPADRPARGRREAACSWAMPASPDRGSRLFGPIRPSTSASCEPRSTAWPPSVATGLGRSQAGQAALRPAPAHAATPSSARAARSAPT